MRKMMRKGMCKHYPGSSGVCNKQFNIRQVTGNEDAGWLLRIPCIKEPAGVMSGVQRFHWNRRAVCADYEEPGDAELLDAQASSVTTPASEVHPVQ